MSFRNCSYVLLVSFSSCVDSRVDWCSSCVDLTNDFTDEVSDLFGVLFFKRSKIPLLRPCGLFLLGWLKFFDRLSDKLDGVPLAIIFLTFVICSVLPELEFEDLI